jgi:hypothetical protein
LLSVIIENKKNAMKRTILILLAILTLTPAALCGQEAESINNRRKPLVGIGFEAGVGGMVPTGSLGDNLKAGVLFKLGANVFYDRFAFKLEGTISQPSFKNENPYAVYDDLGRNLQRNGTASPGLLGLNLQLGCTVWQHGRVSVTPYLGINFNKLMWEINHLKWTQDDEGEERPEISDVTNAHESSTGWMASVDIDIVVHQKRSYSEGVWHTTSSSVRLTPFITHYTYADFKPSFKGNYIGLTVSYFGLLERLSSK